MLYHFPLPYQNHRENTILALLLHELTLMFQLATVTKIFLSEKRQTQL